MAYKSRVNGLNLGTSTEPAKGAVPLITEIPIGGGKKVDNCASNDPGPMTAPSQQGPSRPEATQAPQKAWPEK